MNYLRIFVYAAALILIIPLSITGAAVSGDETSSITIRAGKHSGYTRVVFEGDKSVISKAQTRREGGDIVVSFPDTHIALKKKKLPFACEAANDSVTLSLKDIEKIKTFSLANPSRLVIDIFRQKNATKKPAKKKIEQKVKKSVKKKTVEQAKVIKTKEVKKKVAASDSRRQQKTYDEKDLIPERYKAMWTLLQAGNFYAVLKELPAYKPDDVQSLSAFYYIYAKAHIMASQHLDAVKYLRLAYIYAQDDALKEQALLKRADMYRVSGFVYEARADYVVFLRDFPSSGFDEEAHFGLAESLYSIGLFKEAVTHYQKAGDGPEVLFSMANALQNLGKVTKAEKVYEKALLADKTYPKKSPETYYLIGENMRMAGHLSKAKQHLSLIDFGPFRDRASISLGLVAMEESEIAEAVRNFKAAANSVVEKDRARGLFNLSLAYLKQGNFKEASASLEEIRHNHIDSSLYKDTLLVLSKLYKKEGRIKESVSLLKELVYGKQPPREAFEEIEEIVIKTATKQEKYDMDFVSLWNEVGQWMVDETREAFLLKVADRLRYEGKPFIDLCSWLVENGTERVKGEAAIDLADYYIGIGDVNMSMSYINIAKDAHSPGDWVSRVEVKILRAEGENNAALKKIMMIEKMEKNDLDQLARIITDMNRHASQEVGEAISLYEKLLGKSGWDAEQYINLADYLYAHNEKSKALKYYRIAYRKDPDNEWVMYRVGSDTDMPESKDMFARIEQDDNLLGRMARSKLMEMVLINKVKEVY
jgi:tetratricopeptide (TPR) repeat protein